jgi:hypothetical protein
VAKAVIDESGLPVAAILFIAPVARQSHAYATDLAQQLSDAVPEARHRLGLRPPADGNGSSPLR